MGTRPPCVTCWVGKNRKLRNVKAIPRQTRKETKMKTGSTDRIRLAKPVTAVLLAGLLCGPLLNAQAQLLGGFGGATSLAGAANVVGTTTLAGATGCGGPTALAAGSTLAAGTVVGAGSVLNG